MKKYRLVKSAYSDFNESLLGLKVGEEVEIYTREELKYVVSEKEYEEMELYTGEHILGFAKIREDLVKQEDCNYLQIEVTEVEEI